MSLSEAELETLLLRDRALRALARGLLADAHAADDLVQEAWLAALQSGERALSLPRWLAGAVRNLAGKRRRSEARRAHRERDSARPERDPSTAEILERETARSRVVAAVLALEEPYRSTVALRYFEGLPPRAIAKRHGVPVETVRTRHKRALAELRARLDREFGGERGAWSALLLPLARIAPAPLAPLGPVLTLATMSTVPKLVAGVAGATLIALWFVGRRDVPASAGAEAVVSPATDVALQAPPGESSADVRALVEREPVAAPPRVEPPRRTSAGLGALRVHVSWFDGTPAEAVRVFVQPRWVQGGMTLRSREGLTDAQGEVRVDGLEPGDALVELDRGSHDTGATAEIVAGAEADASVTIPRGFDVTGVVLDPLGAPVAGADVWAERDHDVGFVLARTDARGRFEVRSIQSSWIGARAPGFAPSLCQPLLAGEGAELEIELVLMGRGGALEGAVIDPAGAPIANAWVAVGLDRPLGMVHMLPVGGTREVRGVLSGPIEVRTDAAGRYRVEGVSPGTRRMAVRALGLCAWRGEVEIVEQRTSVRDVQLLPGVTLVGRIEKPDGSPARASVEIEGDGLLASIASTDDDGRYRLDGLEGGELVVRASSARHGRAQTTLHAAPGDTLAWNATLAMGGSIRGRVVDGSGAPLVGWQLSSQDDPAVDEDADFAGAETDADGRFVLRDQHDRPHRVELRPPEMPPFPVVTVEDVHPEREELVLRVTDERLPSVHVVGRVVDALGEPVDDVRLALGARPGSGRVFFPDGSGAFDIGAISPGSWALTVRSPALVDCPTMLFGPRDLVPDETWDCGTIVLERGGTVLVTPSGLDGKAEPAFLVLRDGLYPPVMQREGASWRSGPLQAGEYRLQVVGVGIASVQVPFEIRTGEVTELAPTLTTGFPVQIRIHIPGAGERTTVELRIRDASGAEVLRDQPWLWPDPQGNASPGEFGTEWALAPGSYRVEASLDDGRRTQAGLDVRAGEPVTVRLELP